MGGESRLRKLPGAAHLHMPGVMGAQSAEGDHRGSKCAVCPHVHRCCLPIVQPPMPIVAPLMQLVPGTTSLPVTAGNHQPH